MRITRTHNFWPGNQLAKVRTKAHLPSLFIRIKASAETNQIPLSNYPAPYLRMFAARDRLQQHFMTVMEKKFPTDDPLLLKAVKIASSRSGSVSTHQLFLENILSIFPLWTQFLEPKEMFECVPKEAFVKRFESVIDEICDTRTLGDWLKPEHRHVTVYDEDAKLPEILEAMSEGEFLQVVVRRKGSGDNGPLAVLHLHRILGALLEADRHGNFVSFLNISAKALISHSRKSGVKDEHFANASLLLERARQNFEPDPKTGRSQIRCLVATHNGHATGEVKNIMTTRDAITLFLRRLDIWDRYHSKKPVALQSQAAPTPPNVYIDKERLGAHHELLLDFLKTTLGSEYTGDMEQAIDRAYAKQPYNHHLRNFRTILILGAPARCVQAHESTVEGELPFPIPRDFLRKYTRAVRQVLKQPEIGKVYCRETMEKTKKQPVMVWEETTPMSEILHDMQENQYLQVIVRRPNQPKFRLEVILALHLTIWLHNRIMASEAIDLEHVTAGEFLDEIRQTRTRERDHVEFVKHDVLLDDARRMFLPKDLSNRPDIWMLVITHNGKPSGDFIGIMTAWDALRSLYPNKDLIED